MPFPFLSRKTPFARTLESYGLGNCSLSDTSGALLIGLKARAGYPWLPVKQLPESPRFISFLEAPIQAELIVALMQSPEARTLEHLAIGTSHDWAKKVQGLDPAGEYNMAPAVSALKDARLPALTKLALGDMEMLFNGHRMTGNIGDVTHVFPAAPNLKELSLTGSYALSQPVQHERLEALHAEQSDIGCWAEPPDQATITHLFSSHLPRLKALSVQIDASEDVTFELPETLFSGNGFPSLIQFDFSKPTPTAAAQLNAWAASRGILWQSD